MSFSPLNRAAMLMSPSSPLQIHSRPIPIPGPTQLLLCTKAVAINPSDWKMQDTKTKGFPLVLGSDVAGTVKAVGDAVSSSFVIGERVASFAGGAWSGGSDEAAFQEYVLVEASSTTRIPPSTSFEEACTLPMAVATAASALWITLGLPRPDIKNVSPQDRRKQGNGTGLLVYGASSAVGLMAVQMAHRMGYTIFAVASKKHEKYIKSLGADYVIDRGEKDMVKAVLDCTAVAGLKTPLQLGLDAISGTDSLEATVEILQRCSSEGAFLKLAITLNWPEVVPRPADVIIERTSASHFHVKEENARWLFNEYLPANLQSNTIVPAPPVRLIEGGLDSIEEALHLCKKGLSCEKLVINV